MKTYVRRHDWVF